MLVVFHCSAAYSCANRQRKRGRQKQMVAMRRRWIGMVAAVVLLALLAFAWIDGGRRPLTSIAEPVALPEVPR
jgi:hypothetical protein